MSIPRHIPKPSQDDWFLTMGSSQKVHKIPFFENDSSADDNIVFFDEVDEEKIGKAPSRKRRTTKTETKSSSLPQSKNVSQSDNDKYELPANNKEFIDAFNRSGGTMTINQIMKYTEQVEGFDIQDMTSTADKFLSSLRAPLTDEEVKKLEKQRAMRKKQQDKEYFEQQGVLHDQYDKEDIETFKFE